MDSMPVSSKLGALGPLDVLAQALFADGPVRRTESTLSFVSAHVGKILEIRSLLLLLL
jgi:hypothetical protein